jgi:hypothetical protein
MSNRSVCASMAFVGIVIASVMACGGGGGDGGDNDPVGPGPAPFTVSITTSGSPPPRFIPASTTLAEGGTVTWTNGSPADHNLVATTSNWQLNEDLPMGQSFQRTISQAGTYGYQCTIHPGMIASIEVE